MATINETKYDAMVANSAANVKISSTKFKDFIGDVKDVVDKNSPEGQYAADAGTTDAYVVTLDPAPSAYFEGMVVRFAANTANTGACTLNVNTLGAKTIKKNTSDDMETGDIAADQIIEVIYDGTNFQFTGAATGEIAAHKADDTPHATVQGVDKFGLSSATTLTIASGAITVTNSFHLVDTEAAASSDDLDTINGGAAGDILYLKQVSVSRAVTIKGNGSGNIYTLDRSDIVMGNSTAILTLLKVDGTTWVVIGIQGVKRSGDTITGNILFSGSIALLQAVANAQIQFSGGTATNLGANLILYGQSHSTTPNTFQFRSSATTRLLIDTSGHTTPGGDNTQNLGSASNRWKEIFAGTGTINTSDENEKEQIEDLSTAELNVATAIKGLVKKFKFKDAVLEKGTSARIHVGVIAQDVQDAFTAEGLDAHDYGVFCEDTWWEREETRTPMVDNPDYDPDQPESDDNQKQIEGEPYTETIIYSEEVEDGVEKTRLGVRYTELLAFVITAL